MGVKLAQRALFSAALVVALLTATTGMALAHERRDVGNYGFVVGWIVEPAFEGQKNGVDLRVTDNTTQKPVEGLEKTLKVEITHLATNTTRTFSLRAIFRDPGHYTNDIVPTAPGDYKFHFVGTIGDSKIDETFTSGPNTFGAMESSAEMQFPVSLPAAREMQSGVKGALDASQQAEAAALAAKDSASAASSRSTVALISGLAGIAVGAAATGLALRKR